MGFFQFAPGKTTLVSLPSSVGLYSQPAATLFRKFLIDALARVYRIMKAILITSRV